MEVREFEAADSRPGAIGSPSPAAAVVGKEPDEVAGKEAHQVRPASDSACLFR
jgi:hypothetical protein